MRGVGDARPPLQPRLLRLQVYRFPEDPRLVAIPGFDAAARPAKTPRSSSSPDTWSSTRSRVDNIFVFVVVLNYFAIPGRLQHRVLFFGILGALVFRAIFIALGALLMKF